jgi:hypothetical protein
VLNIVQDPPNDFKDYGLADKAILRGMLEQTDAVQIVSIMLPRDVLIVF